MPPPTSPLSSEVRMRRSTRWCHTSPRNTVTNVSGTICHRCPRSKHSNSDRPGFPDAGHPFGLRRTPALSGLRAEIPGIGVAVENRLTVRPAAGHHRLSTHEIPFLKRSNGHGMTGSSSTIGHMSQIERRNPMTTEHRDHSNTTPTAASLVTRLASNPPQHHTHVQQVAWGLLADRSGGSGC